MAGRVVYGESLIARANEPTLLFAPDSVLLSLASICTSMRNKWYSDNRDLVKWSVLLLLAEGCGADRIIQIAYYKESPFQELEIDGHQH